MPFSFREDFVFILLQEPARCRKIPPLANGLKLIHDGRAFPAIRVFLAAKPHGLGCTAQGRE